MLKLHSMHSCSPNLCAIKLVMGKKVFSLKIMTKRINDEKKGRKLIIKRNLSINEGKCEVIIVDRLLKLGC